MSEVQSDPDNRPHDNKVNMVRGVIVASGMLPLIICSTRLYVRHRITRTFGWDDIFVIAALIAVLGWLIFAFFQTFHGLGRHVWDLEPGSLGIWLKDLYISECIYITVSSLVKISLLVFLMRIFTQKKLHMISKGLIIFLAVFTISGTLILAFQCRPVRAAYIPGIPGSKCFSPNALFAILMTQGTMIFITDIIIIALPMRIIWNLNLPLRKRIAVMSLFGLGSIATIAPLVRISHLVFFKNGTDFTYTAVQAYIWMGVEYSLSLTAGSLSSLRPIITWKGVRVFNSDGVHGGYSITAGSKSRRNHPNSGSIQGTQESLPPNRRIMKTTTIDMELAVSESTENIVTHSITVTA